MKVALDFILPKGHSCKIYIKELLPREKPSSFDPLWNKSLLKIIQFLITFASIWNFTRYPRYPLQMKVEVRYFWNLWNISRFQKIKTFIEFEMNFVFVIYWWRNRHNMTQHDANRHVWAWISKGLKRLGKTS